MQKLMMTKAPGVGKCSFSVKQQDLITGLSIVDIVEEGQSIYYKEEFYYHKMQCVSNSLYQENLMVPRQ